MNAREPLIDSSDDRAVPHSSRVDGLFARWTCGLGFASAVVYYATSEGIRNFAAFLATSVLKVLRLIGHGA